MKRSLKKDILLECDTEQDFKEQFQFSKIQNQEKDPFLIFFFP
jgi:hypothetical protein